MSNLIFALENCDDIDFVQEPVPYDENIEEPHPLYVQMSEGVHQALESMQALNKLRKIFQKNQGKPLSKTSLKIGRLALERIKDDVGIFKNNLIVAQECFTEDSVSVEGITDIMKSVWDAIVRTFKALWEEITKFFAKKEIAQVDKQVKTNHQNLKHAEKQFKKKQAEQKSSSVEPRVRMVPQYALSNFQYLGGKLELADLSKELIKLLDSIRIADGCIQNLEVVNVNMAEAVRRMSEQGFTEDAMESVTLATGYFNSYVKDSFKKDNSDDVMKLVKEQAREEKIDESTVRVLDGLTRGGIVLAYLPYLSTEDTQIHMKVVKSASEPKATEMEFPIYESIIHYSEFLVKTVGEGVNMVNHFTGKSQKMIDYQKGVLHSIERLFREHYYEQGSEADSTQLIRYAQNVTRSLIKFSFDLKAVVRALEVSVLDHTKFSSYLSDSVQAQIKS